MALRARERRGDTYRILLDGRWSLEDLYVFPRTYEQAYFLVGALLLPTGDQTIDERITHAFQVFPWQGGYSAVGFYEQLKYITPRAERPSIRSIEYSSPGWLELGTLLIASAITLSHIVNHVTSAIDKCNATYNQIYRDAQKRKLLGLKIKRRSQAIIREETEFLLDSCEKLANMMGSIDPSTIHSRTNDSRISLKILMSFYRRVRTLANYQVAGRATFADDPNATPPAVSPDRAKRR